MKKAILSRVFLVIVSMLAGYFGFDLLGRGPVVKYARCEVTSENPVVTNCHTTEEPGVLTPFEKAEP